MAAEQARLDELLGTMKEKGEEEPEGEAIDDDSIGSQYVFYLT